MRSALVAHLLIELGLMFFFAAKSAHYGHAVFVEQKERAGIGFVESFRHCRNGSQLSGLDGIKCIQATTPVPKQVTNHVRVRNV